MSKEEPLRKRYKWGMRQKKAAKRRMIGKPSFRDGSIHLGTTIGLLII